MKISMEVDEGMVGKSVQEVLQTLNPEQRVAIARDVMKSWLETTVHQNERALYERDAIEEIRKKSSHRNKETDDEIRNSWEFRDKMQGWHSSKEIMVKKVTDEVIHNYQAVVKEIVTTDPLIQAMREEVAKIVRETFPKMVHDAIVCWFASEMDKVMEGVQKAMIQIPELAKFSEQTAQRLGEIVHNRLG